MRLSTRPLPSFQAHVRYVLQDPVFLISDLHLTYDKADSLASIRSFRYFFRHVNNAVGTALHTVKQQLL